MANYVIKWSVELCKSYAKKFNTITEWNKGHKNTYRAALKYKWLEDCCEHMVNGHKLAGSKRITLWDKGSCIAEANKHATRSDFNRDSNSAYWTATESLWLDECCSHMERYYPKWPKEKCMAIAKTYSSLKEWE